MAPLLLTISYTQDDPPPLEGVVEFLTTDGGIVSEGSIIEVQAQLTVTSDLSYLGPSQIPQIGVVVITDGTANARDFSLDDDFLRYNSRRNGNVMSSNLKIRVHNDTIVESTETLTVRLYSWIDGITLGTNSTYTLQIQDVPPTLGDCDGDIDPNVINCTTSPANPETDVDGDIGNDIITIGMGVTVGSIDGDGLSGSTNDFADYYDRNIHSSYLFRQQWSDFITNNGTATAIRGDYLSFTAGQNNTAADTIINNHIITGDISGDYHVDSHGYGSSDTIINNGFVGGNIYGDNLLGDFVDIGSFHHAHDSIINKGTVEGDIHGDYAVSNLSLGGEDIIALAGEIGGSVYGNGGDDTVLLQDGINGGSDNLLVIDGGTGEDTLVFNLTTFGQNDVEQLGNTASGSVVIEGEQIQWVNFENLRYIDPLGTDMCPDGDSTDNTIICSVVPPTNSNLNWSVDGGLGNDHITIQSNVYQVGVNADGVLNPYTYSPGNGGNDTILYYGTNPDVSFDSTTYYLFVNDIYGDYVSGNGGADYIANYGTVAYIYGDYVLGNGGMDTIINYGLASGLLGDWTNGHGGNDVIRNEATGQAGIIYGDIVFVDNFDFVRIGGDDQITNDGSATVIYGDFIWDHFLFINIPSSPGIGRGGDDIIVNNGSLGPMEYDDYGFIYGDSVYGDGGNDTITNNGVVGAMIGDEVAGIAGNDTIINNGTAMSHVVGDLLYGGQAGQDTIINTGVVYGDILGEADEGLFGEFSAFYETGASDTIINSGSVRETEYYTGQIHGAGGDDLIILQEGTNGGDDNTLPVDGGNGFDTLRFEFPNLDQTTIDALNAANPANGSVTIDGQTITWTNFELIQVSDTITTPTPTPTQTATVTPTETPTVTETATETATQTVEPTTTDEPTMVEPTDDVTPVPTVEVTAEPSDEPTPNATEQPTQEVTPSPTPEVTPQAPLDVFNLEDAPVVITQSTGNPIYTWPAVDGATSYLFYVGGQNGMTLAFAPWLLENLPASQYCDDKTCQVDLTTFSFTAWLTNCSYEVWLCANNADCNLLERWRGPFAFTMNVPAPTAPTQTGATTTTLTWQLTGNAANAGWYQVYIAPTDAIGEYVVFNWFSKEQLCGSWSATTCTWTLPTTLTAGTAYTLWVQPWGPGGFASNSMQGWFGPMTFTP